jgi:hypothetical protein
MSGKVKYVLFALSIMSGIAVLGLLDYILMDREVEVRPAIKIYNGEWYEVQIDDRNSHTP